MIHTSGAGIIPRSLLLMKRGPASLETGPLLYHPLLCQDLFLALQQLVRQEHLPNIFKAQPGHCVGKPLFGLTVGLEEKDTFFHQVQHLFLIRNDDTQRAAVSASKTSSGAVKETRP